jgi:hypothetical protein
MKKYISIAVGCGLLLGFIVICFHPWIGIFPESTFTLAAESRLPKWFSIPSGYTRNDVTVEIYYYVPPPFIRKNFKAILISPPPENKTLLTKIGIKHKHQNYVNDRYQYPTYNVASVDGIEEIIEHKKGEPIFYISDDPKLVSGLKQ